MSYSLLAKLFHWGTVALLAYGIFTQIDGDVLQLEDTSLLYSEILFASVFLALLMCRFIYMNKTQDTALPQETSQFQRRAARFVHLALYASLAAIAITGLAIGALFYLGSRDGLLINSAIELHEVAVSASYWLIAIHVIAALYHRLLNDGVWTAMTPFWKEHSRHKKSRHWAT